MLPSSSKDSLRIRSSFIGLTNVILVLGLFVFLPMGERGPRLLVLFFGFHPSLGSRIGMLFCLLIPALVVGTHLGRNALLRNAFKTSQAFFDFAFSTFMLTAILSSLFIGGLIDYRLYTEVDSMTFEQIAACYLIFTSACLLFWAIAFLIVLFPLLIACFLLRTPERRDFHRLRLLRRKYSPG